MNLAYTGHSPKINEKLTEHSKVMEQTVYQSAQCIYTAVGFGLENPVMIEGQDGIIIVDPAETIEMMEAVMKQFRSITDKPVKAVIVTHNHGDHWGGMSVCVTKEQGERNEVTVIAGELFEEFFSKASGELLDIRMGRAVFMYGSVLPMGEEGYVNLGCGPVLSKGSSKFVRPNTLVSQKQPLKLQIAGIELEIFSCEAETEDAICVYLPQQKALIVGDAIQGEIFPNLYTVRGESRDAKKWYSGIDLLRSYEPEVLIGTHMRPLEGKEKCMALLTDYRDAIQYTHDQAIRMMNRGYTADYAIEQLQKLPPHLYERERMGEYYGTFVQGVRGVYDRYLGWFSGEPSALNPISPAQSAEGYITLMGGREQVLKHGQTAFDKGEFQWCAQLLSLLIQKDPNDKEALVLKAAAVRQLGYQQANATWRNWYLTCALGYEGAFEQIDPAAVFPPVSKSLIGLGDYAMFEALQVKLNGPESSRVSMAVKAVVTDGETVELFLRKGVLEIAHNGENHQADLTISADKETWAQLIAKEITVAQGVEKGCVTTDHIEQANQFFSYFDGFTQFTQMPFYLE